MRHIAGAFDQFLAVLLACVLAEEKIPLWCDSEGLDHLAPVYLSQFIFSHLPINSLFLSFWTLPNSQAHPALTQLCWGYSHCLVEILLYQLFGKILLPIHYVPRQVPSIMIFLAPQTKLILSFSEISFSCYYSICWIIIIPSLVSLC